jgi:hypothetical protein
MFNSSVYSYLQSECVDETPEPSTEETAFKQSRSSYWSGISQTKTLREAEQHRIDKCILFHFSSNVQCALYTVWHGTAYPPLQQQFCPVYVCWNPRESAWGVLFRPPLCWLLL